ncbi:hypothetical protein ACWEVD_29785 [Nocardia thailandica]
MRISTIAVTAVLALGGTVVGGAFAQAEPAAVSAPATAAPGLTGSAESVDYRTEVSEDRRSVVTTLTHGSFEILHENKVVAVRDAAGNVVEALPMLIRAGEHAIALTPALEADGTRLTLTPVGEADRPLRDISAQERFFAETQRLQPQIIEGAAIGAAIGFVLGFPLGLFILDFITVPVATVAGAAIGALAGYAAAGGQPAIDTALDYVTGQP